MSKTCLALLHPALGGAPGVAGGAAIGLAGHAGIGTAPETNRIVGGAGGSDVGLDRLRQAANN